MGTHPIFESDFDCLTEIKMVTTSAKSSAEKLTAKAVGREFVRQYYTMLAKEPRFLHRFYGSSSEMMHGNKDDQFPAVGQSKIREKIKSLNFKDCHTKVAQLDAFLTIGNGICIQVAGEISNNQEPLRRFMQTFVLGPQERDGAEPGTSFYVHNDIFRYQDDIFDDPVEPVESMQKGYEPVSVAVEPVPVVGTTMPQDNGDAAPVGYYQTMTQQPESVSPALLAEVPVINNTGLQVDVTPTLVPELGQPEPQLHEVAVPEPEVENVEPVEPVQPVEIVQEPVQEEEPLQTEPEVTAEVVSPAVEEKIATPTAQQSSAPMSWAARMRAQAQGGGAPPPQQPPAQPVQPAPVKAAPKPAPPVENGNQPPVEPELSQVTQREHQNNHNRYRGDNKGHYENDRPPRREYNDDKQQIFVGGLPSNMTEQDIRDTFSKFGEVRHVRINTGSTGRPGAGFGFVTFSKESEAREALNSKDNIYFKNLQLNIEEKKTREKRNENRGDGFRANGREGYKGRDGPRGPREGGYRQREQQGGPGGRGQDRRESNRGRPKF